MAHWRVKIGATAAKTYSAHATIQSSVHFNFWVYKCSGGLLAIQIAALMRLSEQQTNLANVRGDISSHVLGIDNSIEFSLVDCDRLLNVVLRRGRYAGYFAERNEGSFSIIISLSDQAKS